MMATLTRSCLPDEAVHLAGWFEVQSLLADGSHYSRHMADGKVHFWLYLSRPLDEQDAIPVAVQP
jgi:hypothetical protein